MKAFQSIRTFYRRFCELSSGRQYFISKGIAGILIMIFVGAGLIIDNFRPTPLSDYQCPDFYDLRFGTPIADVIQQVQDAGGPLPDNYDEVDLTAKEDSTLVYSDMDLPFTGLSGARVSCYFEASSYPLRPPYLREITIESPPSEANHAHLLSLLTNYYGKPFESTAQSDLFYWDLDDATIWLYPVAEKTPTIMIRQS